MQVGLINNISHISELNKKNILDPYTFSSNIVVHKNIENKDDQIDVGIYLIRNFRNNKFSLIFKVDRKFNDPFKYSNVMFEIQVNDKYLLRNSTKFSEYGLILDENLNLPINKLEKIKIVVKNDKEFLYENEIMKSDNIIKNFYLETEEQYFTFKIPYTYKFETSSNELKNKRTIFNFQTFVKFNEINQNNNSFSFFSSNFNKISDNDIFEKVNLFFPKFLNFKIKDKSSKKELKLIEQSKSFDPNFINENDKLKFKNINVIFNKDQEYNELLNKNLINDLTLFSFDVIDICINVKHKKFYEESVLETKIEKIAISIQDINTLQNDLIQIKSEDWIEFINLGRISYEDFIIYIRKKYEI